MLAIACRYVEGYRTRANCFKPEPLSGMALAGWLALEPLFGECGEAKLIVSVSFGATALFSRVWVGTVMTNLCLESAVKPNSLSQ